MQNLSMEIGRAAWSERDGLDRSRGPSREGRAGGLGSAIRETGPLQGCTDCRRLDVGVGLGLGLGRGPGPGPGPGLGLGLGLGLSLGLGLGLCACVFVFVFVVVFLCVCVYVYMFIYYVYMKMMFFRNNHPNDDKRQIIR